MTPQAAHNNNNVDTDQGRWGVVVVVVVIFNHKNASHNYSICATLYICNNNEFSYNGINIILWRGIHNSLIYHMTLIGNTYIIKSK